MPRAPLAMVLLGSAQPASAHSLNTQFGDFYGGLLHPITSLEIGLGFLVLALLIGQQGERMLAAARWTLLAFFTSLSLGGVAAIWLPALEGAFRAGYLGGLAALGLLVAANLRLPVPLLLTLGSVAGLFYGLDNGSAMTYETAVWLFVAGIVAGGVISVTPVVAVVCAARQQWQTVGVRVFGSWIAAAGIMLVAFEMMQTVNPM